MFFLSKVYKTQWQKFFQVSPTSSVLHVLLRGKNKKWIFIKFLFNNFLINIFKENIRCLTLQLNCFSFLPCKLEIQLNIIWFLRIFQQKNENLNNTRYLMYSFPIHSLHTEYRRNKNIFTPAHITPVIHKQITCFYRYVIQ